MARTKFTMPSNFTKFPECLDCSSKNFTRIKNETNNYLYICDKCHSVFQPDELGITEEKAEESSVVHQHIKDWNTSTQRNKVAETVADMESRGDKVFRVRKPWEL